MATTHNDRVVNEAAARPWPHRPATLPRNTVTSFDDTMLVRWRYTPQNARLHAPSY
jgi:hypothetical protein